MEENEIATVVLTPMPEFHNAVGIPRSAAIEYPFGRMTGQTNDVAGQREVLLKTLSMLEDAENPGEIRHLPFKWPESPKEAKWQPGEISPIIKENLDLIKKLPRTN